MQGGQLGVSRPCFNPIANLFLFLFFGDKTDGSHPFLSFAPRRAVYTDPDELRAEIATLNVNEDLYLQVDAADPRCRFNLASLDPHCTTHLGSL